MLAWIPGGVVFLAVDVWHDVSVCTSFQNDTSSNAVSIASSTPPQALLQIIKANLFVTLEGADEFGV